MKLKMFALVALMVLGTVGLSVAGGSSIPAKKSNAVAVVAQLVKENVNYPAFAKKEKIDKGTVLVEFTVSNDGSIEILGTNQSDVRFKEYVLDELEKINVKDLVESSNQVYQIKLDFKLL